MECVLTVMMYKSSQFLPHPVCYSVLENIFDYTGEKGSLWGFFRLVQHPRNSKNNRNIDISNLTFLNLHQQPNVHDNELLANNSETVRNTKKIDKTQNV